jgi:RNA recognition motif-containing protein
MNIFISNIPSEITEDELRQLFISFGNVKLVAIHHEKPNDGPDTGCYAYVEMQSKPEAVRAVRTLNGTLIRGRLVNAIEALPLSNKKVKSLSGLPNKL